MRPKFSIIVPIYNVSAFLGKCIDSVLAQRYKNYELILVDDGSTDNSGVICDRYAKEDSRIIVIHKKNGGLSDARNAGLQIAKGEYYYFLDGDDYISDGLLETVVNVLQDHTVDMVFFGYQKISETGGVISKTNFLNKEFCIEKEHEKFQYFIHVLFQYSQGWEAWNRIYKGEIIRKNDLRFVDNDKIYAEDLLFLMMYLMKAKNIIGVKEHMYYYTIRETSIMSTKGKRFNAQQIKDLAVCFYSYIKNRKYFTTRFYLIFAILLYNESQNKEEEEIEKGVQNIRNCEFVHDQIEMLYRRRRQVRRELGVTYAQKILIFCSRFYGQVYTYKPGIIRRIYYKFIIGGLWQYIKYWYRFRNIYIIGSEDAGNLGDHQIAVSMREFLNHYFPRYKIIEWPASRYMAEIQEKGKYIRKRDWICTPGGGNLGDAYPYSEQIRRDVIRRFPKNKIIIFPQTVFFSDTSQGKKEKEITKSIYKKNKRIKLFTRDEKSYERAQEIYDGESALVPDIVLFSDYRSKEQKTRKGALLCIRSDIESNLSLAEKENIEKIVGAYEREYRYIDHQYGYDIPMQERGKYLKEIMEEYRSARLVVTDRLHGMIFAAITGTPCVALDNYNQKVSGVFQWIGDLPYIVLCSNMESMRTDVEEVLSQDVFNMESPRMRLQEKFDELAQIIRR